MKLTAQEIAHATGGNWSPPAPPDTTFQSVSTDTRAITPGALFVALRGENFDAHDFLDQAIESAASALVVRRDAPAPESVPVLRVDDTLRALGDIASAWRAKCPARRVAIVGSSGKTTTKEMLASILRQAGPTHASSGNFNNLIGLPLTLFALEPDHRWAVLELGMNEPGELRRLTEIAQPDLLLFLNVGTAHIGQFDSIEALLAAKAEALDALLPDTPVLYDAASPHTRRIIREKSAGHPLLAFAADAAVDAEVRVDNIRFTPPAGYAFTLRLDDNIRRELQLPFFGRHNIANATAAAAAAHALGVDPDTIVRALGAARPAPMRSETRQVGDDENPVTLIIDCYNANPESMRAALESLAESLPADARPFLVLGDMRELGPESRHEHQTLGRLAARTPHKEILLLGEHTRAATLDACWETGGQAAHYETHELLAKHLIFRIRPGDILFFKGSRGVQLERVVELVETALKSPAPTPANKETE